MALLKLEIIKKEISATDAIILSLKEINNEAVVYEAGQFLTFIIHHYGRELRRSYSICTCPGVDEELAVVVKRQPNGEVSRYIIDNLKVGDVLTSLQPSGRFTLNTNLPITANVFFLAAGSGISPVYSLLKKVLYFEPDSKVVLVYQNHDESSIIFKNELDKLAEKFRERFILTHLLSDPKTDMTVSRRLNNNLLEQLLKGNPSFRSDHSVFYICGPRAYMRMCMFVLKLLGVPDEHIRQEEFVIDFMPPAPFMTDHSPKQVRLKWNDQWHEFKVSYPSNILQAALDHGIHLPYSCRGGRCSTCTIKCNSGKVKLSLNQVLTEKDLKEGFILTCVGYAETDLELEA